MSPALPSALHRVGESFGALTSNAVATVIHALFGDRVTTYIGAEGYRLISHPHFLARIGPSCWGMDGFVLFTLLYSAAFTIFHEKTRGRNWFFFLGGGYVWAFALNVLRIVLIFSGAVILRPHLSPHAFLVLQMVLRRYSGWTIYAIGFGAYFAWFLRRLVDNGRESEPGMTLRSLTSQEAIP